VTLWADAATVYEGEVPELAQARSGRRSHVFDSPMHKRLRNLLDLIAPLNLTDPEARSSVRRAAAPSTTSSASPTRSP
jgi:hypothetical protein